MNKKLKKLLCNKPLVYCALACTFIVGVLVAAYIAFLYSLNHLSFQEVTPSSMAMAMRQDEFWSTYRENTLIFRGTIISLSDQGTQTLVGLKSTDTYSVTCAVDNSLNLKIGESRKFGAETYQAARQPSGVLLNHCIVLD